MQQKIKNDLGESLILMNTQNSMAVGMKKNKLLTMMKTELIQQLEDEFNE